MANAMVLCAGLGTRLTALSSVLPKALMPIGDRAVIVHALDRVEQAGVQRTVVNSHHLSSTLGRAVASFRRRVEVVHEEVLLGTAGGLRNADDALGRGPVLVWNGDIYAPHLATDDLVAAFARCGAPWLWAVSACKAGEGSVGLGAGGRVVRVRGERFGHEERGAEFIGVSVIGDDLRDGLPNRGCLVGDVALPWLRSGGAIATWESRRAFIDVGTPAALLRANLSWLAERGWPFWCAPGAQMSSRATLDRVVVGAGGRVHGEGAVVRSVVFPDGEVTAPACATLAARGAQVHVPDDAQPEEHAAS